MRNKKELMKKAHKLTKEIINKYGDVDYQTQFGLCLEMFIEDEKQKEEAVAERIKRASKEIIVFILSWIKIIILKTKTAIDATAEKVVGSIDLVMEEYSSDLKVRNETIKVSTRRDILSDFTQRKLWNESPPIRIISYRKKYKNKIWDEFPPIRAVSIAANKGNTKGKVDKYIWFKSPPIRAVSYRYCTERLSTLIQLWPLILGALRNTASEVISQTAYVFALGGDIFYTRLRRTNTVERRRIAPFGRAAGGHPSGGRSSPSSSSYAFG